MMKLLKYLTIVLVLASFTGSADRHDDTDSRIDFHSIAEIASDSFISSPDHEFCLPRQISFANTQRVQSAPRRTSGLHKNNVQFAKAGKLMNSVHRYCIQNKTIIIHSSLAEPSHRLLCLCRLII